ncbi:hypothetical protein [Chitinophaga alhagiae]|uniref:hypothetical protein n=1 Tax=Chitinophaga alhagiae TaxID=2203219 RepID=UPI000E5A9FC3|nr:hypothetical protein [Chitinophaga alhagiae]
MTNVLVVLDGLNFSISQVGPVEYIARLARGKLRVMLLGVIPPPLPTLLPAVVDSMYYSNEAAVEHIAERQQEVRQHAEELQAALSAKGLEFTFTAITSDPVETVVRESRFADILLIPHTLSLSGIRDSEPPRAIRQILEKAECPVLTLPGSMQPIKETILAYSGTHSSMLAIRNFFRLFPALGLRNVTVMHVSESGNDTIPDEKLLRLYLEGICRKLTFQVLHGTPPASLKLCLQYRKNVIITLGAYGRSRASRFFRESQADNLLELGHAYFFISHP